MDRPNLVDIDPVRLISIKKYLNIDSCSKPSQIGGFFWFLSEQNKDGLYLTFIVIFFILISLFLYSRYKQKKQSSKEDKINQFVNSVNNYLYTSSYDL
jgi:hypothetical protein